MGGKRKRSRKTELIGYKVTEKKKKLIEKKLRKEGQKLEITITKTNLLEGLVDEWLTNSGVPEQIVRDADMSSIERDTKELLADYNDWWYFLGHYDANVKKMEEAFVGMNDVGISMGKELIDRYDELRERLEGLYEAEPVEEEKVGKKGKTKKKRVRTVGRHY